MGSIPALKTKIPHAEGRGQKNEKKIHGDLEKTTICESDGLDSTSSCPVSAEGLARQGTGTLRMCQIPHVCSSEPGLIGSLQNRPGPVNGSLL